MITGDNQQERLDSYISGYVDGEGSFHVAIQRIKHVRFGYQLVPEFHVSQNLDYAKVLSVIKSRLGCGYMKPNHAKSKTDKSWVFVVKNRDDLLKKVIPFFTRSPILSPKQQDFIKFAFIVRAINRKMHLTKTGFIRLLRIAFSMNRNGRYRRYNITEIIKDLGSSTTIR